MFRSSPERTRRLCALISQIEGELRQLRLNVSRRPKGGTPRESIGINESKDRKDDPIEQESQAPTQHCSDAPSRGKRDLSEILDESSFLSERISSLISKTFNRADQAEPSDDAFASPSPPIDNVAALQGLPESFREYQVQTRIENILMNVTKSVCEEEERLGRVYSPLMSPASSQPNPGGVAWGVGVATDRDWGAEEGVRTTQKREGEECGNRESSESDRQNTSSSSLHKYQQQRTRSAGWVRPEDSKENDEKKEDANKKQKGGRNRGAGGERRPKKKKKPATTKVKDGGFRPSSSKTNRKSIRRAKHEGEEGGRKQQMNSSYSNVVDTFMRSRQGKIRNGANPNRSSSSSSGSRGKKGDRLMALKAQIKEARREAAMWKDRNRDMEAFLQCQRALAEERREQEAAKKRKI